MKRAKQKNNAWPPEPGDSGIRSDATVLLNRRQDGSSPGTPSLNLPYDQLKTPETPFLPARVPVDAPIAIRVSEAFGRNDRVAWIVASAAVLFYRYSGQSVIPVSLRIYTEDGIQTYGLNIPVKGSMSPKEMIAGASLELQKPSVAADPDLPLVVSIRFCDEYPGDSSHHVSSSNMRADVALGFDFHGKSVAISILYNTPLLTQATATRLLHHLQAAMTGLQDHSPTVSQIELFSRDEHAWFATHCRARLLPHAATFVHEEIASQAAKTPDKAAVRFNDQNLTYAALNARANQLARYIRSLGIRKEGRILVCLEPSLEVVVALLAILKAGATYVPVNPAHPVFRIRAIVEDTSPELIITDSQCRSVVDGLGIDILNVTIPPAEIADESTKDLTVDIQREQVAYVYYTSGSTGQPKGVATSHANMIHFINVSRNRYQISADDVIPAVASFAFSISMFELMSALSVGGTLLILERQHVLDAERMTATLQQVTLFHIGPSLLKNIVKFIKQHVPDYSVFGRVRHASSGGDMVPAELLCDMQHVFSSSELYVIYGCSEISLMGCTWELPSEQVKRTFVGKPFCNVHLLVLDDDDNQVPIGAIGDVCFGGPGVAKGYVNSLVRTDDLFFTRDGVRYYRTGDRGRLSSNGDLELLGRRDFQIKVRGMRVELAEIDYHLRQVKGVRDGVVAAKEHGRGEKVLVAYYVPDTGETLRHDDLHAHMASRLPDYMVPVFYVGLEALPLNYNLKVDRKALPEIPTTRSPIKNPPLTKTEVTIARIWCELLHIENVSLDDNFMLLGGDSLLAMEMIFLVQRELSFRLDGMEVLRESLWILARLVDSGTDTSVEREGVENEPILRDIRPVSSYYFGPSGSLYGLYCPAVGQTRSLPVLICPPIGYEYTRCQFLLRTLAERLAEAGAPSLRFDFFGSGDSVGADIEASFERWRGDLRAALGELGRRTGADRVRVLCMRLTAVLALKSLPQHEIDRWVLWDPAIDGALYYRELSRMTREKVHKMLVKRNLKRPARIPDGEELVGTRFSAESVEAMKALVLRDEDLANVADIRQIVSQDFAAAELAAASASRALADFPRLEVPSDSFWYRSTRVTTAITSKEILQAIYAHLQDGQ